MQKQSDGFKFCLLNVCSMFNKINYILDVFYQYNLSFMCLAETWLNDNITNQEFYLSNLRFLRLDRYFNKGGGLFVIFQPTYECIIESTIMAEHIELLHFTISRYSCGIRYQMN